MTSEQFFESILEHFNNKLPFAVYRKPNAYEIKSFCQTEDVLYVISDYTESGFVFSPFDDKQDSVLIPFEKSIYSKCELQEFANHETSQITQTPSRSQKTQHIDLVTKGIDAINAQKLQKVVLSRCESVPCEHHPIDIFKRLLQMYPMAFVYCWYHPKVGLWLGATPETLLTIEGNRLTTMALAGTKPYQGTIYVDWTKKEKDEQQLVTYYIIKVLSDMKLEVASSEARPIQAGNLVHIQTIIKTNLKPETYDLKQLLGNLHPTPAVCGLPKEDAKQFILNNEAYNREFYTGFLGELNIKEKKTRNSNRHNVENDAYATIKTISNLYVNLRCMQIKPKNALIYVGGGITIDSSPEAEWEETVHKSLVMKKVFQ